MKPFTITRDKPLSIDYVGVGFRYGFLLLAGGFLYLAFTQKPNPGRQTHCLSNLKMMGVGLRIYAEDYDERLPAASAWMDSLAPYLKDEKAFHCPEVLKTMPLGYGYAFNSHLSQHSLKDITDVKTKPWLYDARNPQRNANAPGMREIANPPRHGEGAFNNIGYADGHVKSVRMLPESSP